LIGSFVVKIVDVDAEFNPDSVASRLVVSIVKVDPVFDPNIVD
jgi:hypothetical protein